MTVNLMIIPNRMTGTVKKTAEGETPRKFGKIRKMAKEDIKAKWSSWKIRVWREKYGPYK